MRRYIFGLALVAATMSVSVQAQPTDETGALNCDSMVAMLPMMKNEARAVVKTQCPDWEQRAGQSVTNQLLSVTTEDANKISEAVTAITAGIGQAARELGVAANEFLATDAGLLTAGLITWKVAGDDIKEIASAVIQIPFALLVMASMAWFTRKMFTNELIYVNVKRPWTTSWLFGPEKQIVQRTHRKMTDWSEGDCLLYFIIMSASTVITLVLIF